MAGQLHRAAQRRASAHGPMHQQQRRSAARRAELEIERLDAQRHRADSRQSRVREGMLRRMLPVAVVAGVILAPPLARPEEKFSLKSVSVDLPASDRIFPNGHGSDEANENCLICHSAGMVLTQPGLSKAQW